MLDWVVTDAADAAGALAGVGTAESTGTAGAGGVAVAAVAACANAAVTVAGDPGERVKELIACTAGSTALLRAGSAALLDE